MSDNNNTYQSSQILGLNISDFMLFMGAIGSLIAVIFQNIRSSRCTKISLCGFIECIRNIPPNDDDIQNKPQTIGNNKNIFKFEPAQIKPDNDNKI
jgi:hypothetical protein